MIPFPALLSPLVARIPKALLLCLAGAAVVVGLLWGTVALWQNHGAREYARGRKDALDQAQVGRGVVQIAAAAQRVAQAKSDSARARLTTARTKLAPAIAALPDEVAALPPVRHLIATSLAIDVAADSLERTLDVERAVSHMRAQVDSTARIVAQLAYVARGDTIADLRARPTRLQAGATAIGTGLIAFLFGRFAR